MEKDDLRTENPGQSKENSSPLPDVDLFRRSGWDLEEKSLSHQSREAAVAAPRRTKSSNRMRYEAEVELIRRKIGDLEVIREKLGLTQRKISQLLLVDPSAWTRWTKHEEDAPPHIYRMLQWYLALEEKYPALDVGFWLSAVAKTTDSSESALMREAKLSELVQQVRKLNSDVLTLRDEGSEHSKRGDFERFERNIETRLQNIRRRERWLFVWLFLFAAGVAMGLALARI